MAFLGVKIIKMSLQTKDTEGKKKTAGIFMAHFVNACED